MRETRNGRLVRTILVVTCLLSWLSGGFVAVLAREPPPLTITYIANAGVLLASGDAKVLVDGLHRPYEPAYLPPAPDLLEEMERARPPFDQVDLVLVTHLHRDHFHPQSVARHLRHNPRARLFTSLQVADEVTTQLGADGPLERVIGISAVWKQTVGRTFGDIQVEALSLRHGSERFRWVTNIGYLVHLGGRTVLHVGDAEMSEENFEAFSLHERTIDVAILPFWFLTTETGRRLVDEQIQPERVVAVHVDPREARATTERVRAFDPRVTVLTASLQSIVD